MLSILIGGVTLSGSVVAYLKLQGKISGQPILIPGRHAINLFLFLGAMAVGSWAVFGVTDLAVMGLLAVVCGIFSMILGIMLVIPIGGADMPVVISLLNSYSGLAAAATGFVLNNNLLIISGALVGASGLILTNIMCVAMNRTLVNVLFGGFGIVEDTSAKGGPASDYGTVRSYSAEDGAMVLASAQSVVFVPGYGLAVAQAQHVVRELATELEKRGARVSYGIHPVAGRMPGHMNVLLAEADVPYEQLLEMDAINPEFKETDVVMVVGANDVVNPAAERTPGSPIYGMPVLQVWEARTVDRDQAQPGAGVRGHQERAVRVRQHDDDLRRRQEGVAGPVGGGKAGGRGVADEGGRAEGERRNVLTAPASRGRPGRGAAGGAGPRSAVSRAVLDKLRSCARRGSPARRRPSPPAAPRPSVLSAWYQRGSR